jgi:hypothetical protein
MKGTISFRTYVWSTTRIFSQVASTERQRERHEAIKRGTKDLEPMLINRKLLLLCYWNCQSSVTFRTKAESGRTKERSWERRLLPYRPHPSHTKRTVTVWQTQPCSVPIVDFEISETSTITAPLPTHVGTGGLQVDSDIGSAAPVKEIAPLRIYITSLGRI